MKRYAKSLITIQNIVTFILAFVLIVCITHVTSAAREKQYVAKQISNFRPDGDISEWEHVESVPFNQLKDAGNALPDSEDFTASGRVAWSTKEPNMIYFLVEVTDDIIQNIHPADDKWWEDDSVEFMFDFDNTMVEDDLVQWTLGTEITEISAAASDDNTLWAISRTFTNYFFEVAIDPTAPRGPNPRNNTRGKDFKAHDGLTIGFSFQMNDCENGVREHQIGWTAGGAWDPLNFGDLIFDNAYWGVEPSGKLSLTWGALKQ